MRAITGKTRGDLSVVACHPHRKPSGESNPIYDCQCKCGKRLRLKRGQFNSRTSCGHEEWSALEIADTDAAYVAGLIDGEGCLPLVRSGPSSYAAKMSIGMTDKEYLQSIKSLCGVGRMDSRKPQKEGWKACHVWTVGSSGLRRLLTTVEPYLILKKRQAVLLSQYLWLSQHKPGRDAVQCREYHDMVRDIVSTINALNRKGGSVGI